MIQRRKKVVKSPKLELMKNEPVTVENGKLVAGRRLRLAPARGPSLPLGEHGAAASRPERHRVREHGRRRREPAHVVLGPVLHVLPLLPLGHLDPGPLVRALLVLVSPRTWKSTKERKKRNEVITLLRLLFSTETKFELEMHKKSSGVERYRKSL